MNMQLPSRTEPGPLSDGSAAFPFAPPWIGPSGERRWDDVVYAAETGYRPLFLDLRVPASSETDQKLPLVIWIHGGGWVHGSRRRQAPNIHAYRAIERIVDAGFAVAIIDYRLAFETALPAQICDVRAAIRWLRAHAEEFALDPARVAVWGESAGAHIACLVGMADRVDGEDRVGEFHEVSPAVQAIVEWYGPVDMRHFPRRKPAVAAATSEERGYGDVDVLGTVFGGSPWTLDELSPQTYVRAGLPPIFIAHGRKDQQVPVEQSRRFHAALAEVGAMSEYFEADGDHVFVDADTMPEVIRRSIDFLRRLFLVV